MRTHWNGQATKSYVPGYDGNGNVVTLWNSATGTQAAQYEYGPFGELLKATGPVAGANPFRFSTKYTDGETGLVYYGYRYYAPNQGRWINRDPIKERGGVNLFGFVKNCALDYVDILGMADYKLCGTEIMGWNAIAVTLHPNAIQKTASPGNVTILFRGDDQFIVNAYTKVKVTCCKCSEPSDEVQIMAKLFAEKTMTIRGVSDLILQINIGGRPTKAITIWDIAKKAGKEGKDVFGLLSEENIDKSVKEVLNSLNLSDGVWEGGVKDPCSKLK